jgi:hypothetical protein
VRIVASLFTARLLVAAPAVVQAEVLVQTRLRRSCFSSMRIERRRSLEPDV